MTSQYSWKIYIFCLYYSALVHVYVEIAAGSKEYYAIGYCECWFVHSRKDSKDE